MSVLDDFNRANAGTLGANWTDVVGGHQIVSNQCREVATGWNLSMYSGVSWNATQSAKITKPVGSADYYGAAVRVSATGGGQGYAIFYAGTDLFSCVNGVFASIGTPSDASNPGDDGTIEIFANGTTIDVERNGVNVLSLTNSAHSSGAAGIASYDDSTNPIMDNWIGTGESGGAVFMAKRSRPVLQAVNQTSTF